MPCSSRYRKLSLGQTGSVASWSQTCFCFATPCCVVPSQTPPPIGTWPLMCSRAMASLPMSSGRTSKLDSFSLSRPNWWGLSLDEPLSPRWACWNWGLVIYLYVRCQLRVFIWIFSCAAHLPQTHYGYCYVLRTCFSTTQLHSHPPTHLPTYPPTCPPSHIPTHFST